MKPNKFLYLVTGFLLILFYQNCSRVETQQKEQGAISAPSLNASGNGDGYSGKLTRFEQNDPMSPCQEIAENKKPLPNGVIYAYPEGKIELVRSQCKDIVPFAVSDFNLTENFIEYNNLKFFATEQPSDFQVLAASCPPGTMQNASSNRINLFSNSIDLVNGSWSLHPGLSVTPDGTLAGLPLFKIKRISPALTESWRRLYSHSMITTNQRYVFSFFAKTNVSENAYVVGYLPSNGAFFQSAFNLMTGLPLNSLANGFSNISYSTKAFSDGLFISVYFTPGIDDSLYVGVAQESANLETGISVTALQLENISNFCN